MNMRWKFGSYKQLFYSLILVFLSSAVLILGMIGLEQIGVHNLTLFNSKFFTFFPIYSAISLSVIVGFTLMKVSSLSFDELGWRLDDFSKNVFLGFLGCVAISLVLFFLMSVLGILNWENFVID